MELINAVAALGKPTIAVISMEGPYALASVIDKLPAVLTDYYGGPYQAMALADAIFGVTNPGGKLPFTMPLHVGQMPIHYAQKWGSGYRRTKDDIHHGYLDMPSTPLFAFGHGGLQHVLAASGGDLLDRRHAFCDPGSAIAAHRCCAA